MKRVLRIIVLILICVEAVIAVCGFFSMLAQGFVEALVSLALSAVVLVPLIAVAVLLAEVEELEIKVNYLQNENILKDVKDNPIESSEIPEFKKGRNAILSWTCAKCGYVNKAGTANCEHCGSAY